MAKISNENIFVNIKELPQIGGIESGDLLIVETEDGTNIMDFDDLVIDTYQTTFYSVLTANDLALDNAIVELEEDLADLQITVDALGGTAFNALSAQIYANTVSITSLEASVETTNETITQIQTDVTTISAVVESGGIKAYGYVGMSSGGAPTYITSFTDLGKYNVQYYQHVRFSTTIPIVGSISPYLRVWNIVFARNIEINYVDIQLANISYSQSRRFDVSMPMLSTNQTPNDTYYVSVSTQGPGTGDSGFKVRFSAF
jgi:hypothetical protein